MIFRLITIATALVGGAALIRRTADTVVEQRRDQEIEKAKARASYELSREAAIFSRQQLIAFLIRTIEKAVILGFFALLYDQGHISVFGIRLILSTAIAFMLVNDLARIARPAMLAFRKLKSSGWNISRALREFVAALAFDEAYKQSASQMVGVPTSAILMVSSFNRDRLSTEIAEAISEVAREASIRQIRPHLVSLAISVAIIASLYSFFLISTFAAI